MKRILLFGLVVVVNWAWLDLRGQSIVVGNHNLQPNMAGQQIQISVTGGANVAGLNLNVQIGDGLGGSPRISGVDILTGTIFAPNNTGATDGGSTDYVAVRSTTTSSGTVSADGLLTTVTLDTTGFNSGTWAFNLDNTLNGATDFAGVMATITDGSITVVPEPATYGVVFALGSLTAGVMLRRRRRA